MIVDLERRADHADDRKLGGSLDYGRDRVEACVQQCPLLEQVVACVRRNPQFREQREDSLAISRVANERDGLLGVVGRVGDANGRHSNRDSHEIVVVEIEKAPVPDHAASSYRKTVPIVDDLYKVARAVLVSSYKRHLFIVSFWAKRRIPIFLDARRRHPTSRAHASCTAGILPCALNDTRRNSRTILFIFQLFNAKEAAASRIEQIVQSD